jgi:hypothetical protein
VTAPSSQRITPSRKIITFYFRKNCEKQRVPLIFPVQLLLSSNFPPVIQFSISLLWNPVEMTVAC